MREIPTHELLDTADPSIYDVPCRAAGPEGKLPLTADMLRTGASGDAFGMSQDAGMGWTPAQLAGPKFVMLSTLGGLRRDDGSPVALGYHTGHWELGMLLRAAADAFRAEGAVPHAGHCSDPCDGRTQGTAGMFDSLAYRNDAAIVFRRLARSIPRARGVLGVATCDKGLPAMMMALAGMPQMSTVIVPGGVMLAPTGGEDTAKVQSIGARFARGELSLEAAAELGCRACASPGGGCQFLGTAASAQVVAEALGMALPHSALAPSGTPLWLDIARRSAKALVELSRRSIATAEIVTEAAVRNAMVVHAAFGGSTNLLLHLPAVAFAAGVPQPSVDDWIEVNRQVPRLVDALPNGPQNHPTVFAYMAGGVPEVMLHLRDLGLLSLDVMTVAGCCLGETLDWWEHSERRATLRRNVSQREGLSPDEIIFSPARAQAMGLTGTVCFPRGNLAPDGAVVKSTSIDPSVVDADGVYRKTGPARVFVREKDAVDAIKGVRGVPVEPGDIVVLAGRGPLGAGMEECYQVTSALRYLSWGKEVAVLTDARFSGVSTGACIGHISPEALAGGPLGKLRDGDLIRIVIDRRRLEATVDLVGSGDREFSADEAEELLAARSPHLDLAPDPRLTADTRLWAALQQASGGVWSGCVYDPEAILTRLR